MTYTRKEDGRISTRAWPRTGGDVTTTYAYDSQTGDPTSVSYDDGTTPSVVYNEYYRDGQLKRVTDAAGSRTFTYTSSGQVDEETINGNGGGLYGKTITRSYESTGTGEVPGRYNGFSIGTDYSTTYKYDAGGRLERVLGKGLDETYGARYERLANSDLVRYVEYKGSSDENKARTERWYEGDRDVLDWMENRVPDATTPLLSKYDYATDNVGRRTFVGLTGLGFSMGPGDHHCTV